MVMACLTTTAGSTPVHGVGVLRDNQMWQLRPNDDGSEVGGDAPATNYRRVES
jgi:hypothetical protein